ncbi:MAG: glutamate-1-semialdehyde 2,1-aminomutase [Firmicutes bacterium]|nr:glutamate-1-semialdehyde 2,1-aminomutase [Bacillota bacterium]
MVNENGGLSAKSRSLELYAEAERYIPGGVNSPVRAYKAVDMHPLFIDRGEGSRIYDVDGHSYIDYVCSWGPLILGHAHPKVVEAIKKAAEKGTSYGAPTELETRLARLIVEAVPSIERVRMVNSGTEATMSALRVARGYTGRNKIIKFAGCYHGHADSLLVSAGSGAITLGIPGSAGVTQNAVRDTIVLPYNDLAPVEEAFSQFGEDIAAVIVEPIAGNMGLVLPKMGYLEGLRRITRDHGALLIFDEVITGFRVAPGGAQELYNVAPDLTCLGKIIGGGLPVGAYGGKKEIMGVLAPSGPVYQAGTLSGNPLAMAAGIAVLELLQDRRIYEELEGKTSYLLSQISDFASKNGIPVYITRAGSMFCVFFTHGEVFDYDTAKTADVRAYSDFFKIMLKEGIYLASSQFETAFLSAAHSEEDVERTVAAYKRALIKVAATMGP